MPSDSCGDCGVYEILFVALAADTENECAPRSVKGPPKRIQRSHRKFFIPGKS